MSDKVVVHLGRKLLRVSLPQMLEVLLAFEKFCFCDHVILVPFLYIFWTDVSCELVCVLMFQSGNKKRVYSAMLVTEKNYMHRAWWCFKSKETKSTVFVPNILPLLNLLHFQLLCCFETSMGVVSQLKVSFSS